MIVMEMNRWFNKNRQQGQQRRETRWKSANQRRRAQGDATRELVKQYFLEHLGCTRVECAADLGLSGNTVNKYVQSIRAEWRE